jgi:tetratricopeptide (TPR) repeat protein
MKHFSVILFTIFGFSLFSAAQTTQEMTPESVERRLERSDRRLENEKQRERARTWVDRGYIFQDIFDVNIQALYLGMPKDETRLFMGQPNQVRTEQTQSGTREVFIYDNIEVFFDERGTLVSWEETKVIHEDPLEEAYQAFQKAIELEETGEDKGFFARIFSSSQENRITNGFLRLHGQFVSQAVKHYEKQNFDDAFHSFKRSIDIVDSPYYTEPLDTGLVFNTGFVAGLAGKYEESLVYLNRAKEMGYGQGSLYVLIKEAYVEMGDSIRAEEALQQGFQRFPDDNIVLVELVNFYIHAGKSDEALNYLRLAKEQEPDNPSFHYAEGALHDELGNPDRALEAYRRALELNPDYFDPAYNAGVLFYNRAVRMLEKANEIMDNVQYEKAREEAFEVLRESVPFLEQAHINNPDHHDTMETLRIIYYRLGMEDKLEEMNKKLGREVLQ